MTPNTRKRTNNITIFKINNLFQKLLKSIFNISYIQKYISFKFKLNLIIILLNSNI